MKNNRGRIHSSLYSFIPKKINNRIVIKIYDLLRKLQRLRKNDYNHFSANLRAFERHLPHIRKSHGYINDQHNYTDMYYGKVTVSYSGCGVIAVYNILNCFGTEREMNLAYLIKEFETDGMVLSGRGGTSPLAAYDYFLRHGYNVRFTADINEVQNITADAYIATIYNNKDDISRNIHSIAIVRNENGRFIALNCDCNGTIPEEYESIHELLCHIKNKNAKMICILGID
ncbi:MAG: hypothetical protein E7218_04515 [Anaerofustis stercorihominis]|nr:hypothetical protein [Anaerofustis stercorihominis]